MLMFSSGPIICLGELKMRVRCCDSTRKICKNLNLLPIEPHMSAYRKTGTFVQNKKYF